MEFRDVLYGNIEVSDSEEKIILAPFFQKLKNIKQLGFAENAFPGATHNRFSHSLGAMYLAQKVFDSALKNSPLKKFKSDYERLRQAIKVAALLHDIGHGPLSHTTEFAMPLLEKLNLNFLNEPRQANHEDYTLKIILDSSMTEIIEKALKKFDIKPIHIASIINDSISVNDDFFKVDGINYRPILHQMISSEIDVDRMDYLVRDSYYCGVQYGAFDQVWLIDNLSSYVQDNQCFLALNHRALYTFEDFLISRFHMFMMVYFHHKSIVYDELLAKYLKDKDCNYSIPSQIEDYIYYDDYHLYTHLGSSKNEFAKRIYHKKPYQLFCEFHSNLPMHENTLNEQEKLIKKIIEELKEKKISYILKSSTGELSRYYKEDSFEAQKKSVFIQPIYVRYDDKYNPVQFLPLEKCTDLFQKYSKKRVITRIYIP